MLGTRHIHGVGNSRVIVLDDNTPGARSGWRTIRSDMARVSIRKHRSSALYPHYKDKMAERRLQQTSSWPTQLHLWHPTWGPFY